MSFHKGMLDYVRSIQLSLQAVIQPLIREDQKVRTKLLPNFVQSPIVAIPSRLNQLTP
jgi:hypothetical protein